jgi:DNA-3-methyladenine glycosylase
VFTTGKREGKGQGLENVLGPLPEEFYRRHTADVARALLGTYLVHTSAQGRTTGRIVETEAYLGANDPASHAFRGRSERNAVMFGEPGSAYIYFTYGRYYCLNVSTMPEGTGEAVLLRALQPVEGIDLMRERRAARSGRSFATERLCDGPAKLVLAMGVTPEFSGHDLRQPTLMLLQNPADAPPQVEVTRRIGITKAADLPLRFSEAGSRFVSRTLRASQRSDERVATLSDARPALGDIRG